MTYVLPRADFLLKWLSCIVATETEWPAKPKIFTICCCFFNRKSSSPILCNLKLFNATSGAVPKVNLCMTCAICGSHTGTFCSVSEHS